MKQIIQVIVCVAFILSCSKKQELSDAYGNFEATTVTISSEANGKLVSFEVTEGQRLEKGALIGLVDTTTLALQKQQVLAKIGTLPKKLRNTLADIEVIENQIANATRERDRIQRLVDKKAATTQQLDDLNGKIDVLQKQINAIKSQTSIANRAILAEKEPMYAQLALIDEQIRRAQIHNPITGTVLTKLAETHEMVAIGKPLYRIGKLDTMTLRFYIDAVQLQAIKVGVPVKVLIDEGVEEYKELEGTISWIADQSEFTPKTIQTKEDRVNLVYAVKAQVPNTNGLLKIGMPAEINFASTTAE